MNKNIGFTAVGAVMVFVLLSLISAVSVVSYVRYQQNKEYVSQEQTNEVSNTKLEETPNLVDQVSSNKTTEAIVIPEQSIQQTLLQNPEIVFADNLNSCAKYKTTFVHPFTKEIMEKEILGIINGKCNYVEQMPGGGKLECKYSESDRINVAQYYKDIALAESTETHVYGDIGELKKIYKINGVEVENPLQKATDNGTCIISGY